MTFFAYVPGQLTRYASAKFGFARAGQAAGSGEAASSLQHAPTRMRSKQSAAKSVDKQERYRQHELIA